MIEVAEGGSPLILGLPHTGTEVPEPILRRLNAQGRALADTDWHVDRLYAGLADATTVRTPVHRYVIDVNRDPTGVSLYPGQTTTGLVPLTDFDGAPIWDEPPSDDEIAERRQRYHAPYHAALAEQIARLRDANGFAVLYDCHSIRSEIPFLFDGHLPDFNIGTDGSRTCAPEIETAVTEICVQAEGYSHVLNGRFRGGWTTRHYGQPDSNIHAIQMELAQATYMEEAPPWRWREDRAARLRPILARILATLAAWRPA